MEESHRAGYGEWGSAELPSISVGKPPSQHVKRITNLEAHKPCSKVFNRDKNYIGMIDYVIGHW